MASQTPGIQQLLLAEKKASEKVSEARKGKFVFYIRVVTASLLMFEKEYFTAEK